MPEIGVILALHHPDDGGVIQVLRSRNTTWMLLKCNDFRVWKSCFHYTVHFMAKLGRNTKQVAPPSKKKKVRNYGS